MPKYRVTWQSGSEEFDAKDEDEATQQGLDSVEMEVLEIEDDEEEEDAEEDDEEE